MPFGGRRWPSCCVPSLQPGVPRAAAIELVHCWILRPSPQYIGVRVVHMHREHCCLSAQASRGVIAAHALVICCNLQALIGSLPGRCSRCRSRRGSDGAPPQPTNPPHLPRSSPPPPIECPPKQTLERVLAAFEWRLAGGLSHPWMIGQGRPGEPIQAPAIQRELMCLELLALPANTMEAYDPV